MALRRENRTFWVAVVLGPALALAAFFGTYLIRPLKIGGEDATSAVPSLALSTLILFVTFTVTSHLDSSRAAEGTDRIYAAVRDYLHVTKVGTPQHAWDYVMARLPALEEVRNTSFNLKGELEKPNERFYESDTYQRGPRLIAEAVRNGLRWKDVGDSFAVARFREFAAITKRSSQRGRYEYGLIGRTEPQINFILLTYANQDLEVLFNWDYRAIGREPTVLLSRDPDIVSLFAVQYEHLWRRSSPDHDSNATRSTPTK